MKKITSIVMFCALLVFTNGFAQLTPKQMIKKMGRGINIGNVMSAPVEGNWSPAITEQYFTDVKAAGFKTVRIPMDFFGTRTTGSTSNYSSDANTSSSYTGNMSDYSVTTTYLDRVEEVVNWALSKGLIAIIDFHGSNLKTEFLHTFANDQAEYTSPTSAKRLADLDKFKAIWTAISNRFKDKSDDLIFEIVNEPYFEVSEADMNSINTDIINVIRGTGSNNTTRKIIITGGTKTSFEAPTTISSSIISSDDYLIATFHYYRPFSFTSSSKNGKDDNDWGNIADKNTVTTEFDSVKTWSEENDIPVLLGEFGADNTQGYKYSTGDLSVINSNTTGFADGGPDNASRVEYHRYISEQAINRGFAFTVWDSGPSSNKTINMRSDATSTVNYNIANFSVTSYNPKVTIISTVVDNSKWVTDVKDALFSSGIWPEETPTCDSTANIITNANFECDYNSNWSVLVSGTADATFSDATTNSKTGSKGASINVITADVYNKVILKNTAYTSNVSGSQIVVKSFAKASTNNQTMKIRIKAVSGGVTTYNASPVISLTTNYTSQAYEYTYIVPSNTTSLETQVLLGNESGTYYLDDFSFTITALDSDNDGYNSDVDCNDSDAAVNPGATEILYNGIDDDCNSSTLDTEDIDNDGYNSDVDCNDSDAAVNPGVIEILYNGIDDDCNSSTLDTEDSDNDGYNSDIDCNDNDAAINPGATEISNNGIDDDCNSSTPDQVSYTLSVNSINGSVSPNSGTYLENTSVTLTAIPDSGYEFSSWSGDVNGFTNPLTFTMDGNKSITANFTTIPTSNFLTISAIDDAHVRNGSYKNDNFGSYNKMQIRQTSTSNAKRYTYLKFNLSGISNVISATLRINNNGDNGDVLLKKVSNDSWLEGNLTWKNKPSLGSTINTYSFNGVGDYDLDVTSYVSTETQGDGTVSFALKGSTSNYMTISSKESGNSAKLIIEYGNNAKSSGKILNVVNPESEENNPISIYPNPTTSLLNFKIHNSDVYNGKIQIFDITGRLVSTKVISNRTMQLRLDGPSGIYIVKIINNEFSAVKRIVKQ